MEQKNPLHDRVAWISGASRGIGRAIAARFAAAGAHVILGARSIEALQQSAEVIRSQGGKADALALDVTSWAKVQEFADAAVQLAGPPSIIVNNAGVGFFKDFAEMAPEDFDRQIDVNLKGAWYLARAGVTHMKRLGDGNIINISSIAGEHPFKRGTAYCAAKAGLNAMSEAMMLELREFGIRVTTLAPGSVETRFHQQALPAAHHQDQSWMLEPETIADACMHILTLPASAILSHYEIRPLNTGK